MEWLSVMVMKPHYMVWLVISAVVFSAGEFFSKKFANEPSIGFVVCILLAYCLEALLWLPALLQRNELAVVGAMWSVLSMMATVAIGTLLFGEVISTTNIAGLAVGTIALILLSL